MSFTATAPTACVREEHAWPDIAWAAANVWHATVTRHARSCLLVSLLAGNTAVVTWFLHNHDTIYNCCRHWGGAPARVGSAMLRGARREQTLKSSTGHHSVPIPPSLPGTLKGC